MLRTTPCFTARVGKEPRCHTESSLSTLCIPKIHNSLWFEVASVPSLTPSLGGGCQDIQVPDGRWQHLPPRAPAAFTNQNKLFLIQHLPEGTINLSIGQKREVNAHAMLHTHYWKRSPLLIWFLKCYLLSWIPGAPADACRDGHILGAVVLQPASWILATGFSNTISHTIIWV